MTVKNAPVLQLAREMKLLPFLPLQLPQWLKVLALPLLQHQARPKKVPFQLLLLHIPKTKRLGLRSQNTVHRQRLVVAQRNLPRGTARTDMAILEQDKKYIKFKIARHGEMAGQEHQAEEIHTGTATETATETTKPRHKFTLSFPPRKELVDGITYNKNEDVLGVHYQYTRAFVHDG